MIDPAWVALTGRLVTVHLSDGAAATGGLQHIDARPGGYLLLVSPYTDALLRVEEPDINGLEERG